MKFKFVLLPILFGCKATHFMLLQGLGDWLVEKHTLGNDDRVQIPCVMIVRNPISREVAGRNQVGLNFL